MRIASLVPSSTEMLFELGLGDAIVAVTHECDYPPSATLLPHATRSVLPDGLSAAEIDRAVRQLTGRGEPIYALDADLLDELEPDLIVTQAVCEVCAVSYEDVRTVAERLDPQPTVLSLDPATLGEIFSDIRRLGEAAWVPEEAEYLVARLSDRIDAVRSALTSVTPISTLALEWLDPPYIGGHWIPQMIELAGGYDVAGFAGERSRATTWRELETAGPEVVVSMPCGYAVERAAEEALAQRDRLATLGPVRVVAVDASAYFSRPGPRLVDGIELLAHVLHPERVDSPPPSRLLELDRQLSSVTG